MGLSKELADKIARTSVSGSGQNIRHGRYVLMLDKWEFRHGHKGISDIHEFIVVKSDKIVVMEDTRVEAEPNAVDTRCSAVYNYDGAAKVMAPINTKRFLLGLLGKADVTEEEQSKYLMGYTNDDPKNGLVNPCRGMIIGCETYPIRTVAGKWIIGTNWLHIAAPGQGDNALDAAKARYADYERRLTGFAA